MKKVSMFILALVVCITTFVTISAFTIQNSTTVSKIATISNPGEPVEITFNRYTPAGLRARTFLFTDSRGTINGTWTMAVTTTGKAFHCVNTLTYNTNSVLIALSNCNNTTMNGVWHIVSGSGYFEGISGNGSLEMFLRPNGKPDYEVWNGTIK